MKSLIPRMSSTKAPRVVLPTTRLGWWAVRLAGASVVLLFAAPLVNLIPGFAPVTYSLTFAGALVSGALAPIAIIRDKERALSVFATMIPLLFYLALLVLELSGVGLDH